MITVPSFIFPFLLLFLTSLKFISAFEIKKCEVCTDTLTDVMKMAKEKSDMPDIALIRESLFDLCESIKKTDRKKRDLCSHFGAYPDSPTSIVNDVVKPLSFSKPPEKVCKDIKNHPEVCELEYDAPFDWEELEKELDKMKIKELRAVLNKLNDPCKGCSEKGDLISRIRELRPAKTDDKTEL